MSDAGDRTDAEHTDELPEDLDASGYVGPYVFPDNNRRRIPGYLYLVTAAVCIGLWATAGETAVLVNGGFLAAGIVLAAVGVYHLLSGYDLVVDERDALVAASRSVGFAIGHASAQMGWRGLRSRPDLAHPALLGRGTAPSSGASCSSTASTATSSTRSWNPTPRTGPIWTAS